MIISLSNLAKQTAELKPNDVHETLKHLAGNHSNRNDSEVIFDSEIFIPYNSITPIRIQNLSDSLRQQIEFGIVQLHVGFPNSVNLTLSYNRTLVPNYYQNGTNLGLIIYSDDADIKNTSKDNAASDVIYIHNSFRKTNESAQLLQDSHKNSSDGISALIVFIIYYRNSSAPLPGGCNLEYSMMQEAPIMSIEQHNGFIVVDTPLAAAAAESLTNKCETNDTKHLQYETRYLYLPSSLESYSSHDFFNYIRSMLTVSSAEKTGYLVNKNNKMNAI